MDKFKQNQKLMDESYNRFASHITALKMDHNNGQTKSDELTAFLGSNYICLTAGHPKEDASI